jgi:hypothetical protein
MTKRHESGEYAAAPATEAPRYKKGDQVRLRATGQLCTVDSARQTTCAYFVVIKSDKTGKKATVTADKIVRADALF